MSDFNSKHQHTGGNGRQSRGNGRQPRNNRRHTGRGGSQSQPAADQSPPIDGGGNNQQRHRGRICTGTGSNNHLHTPRHHQRGTGGSRRGQQRPPHSGPGRGGATSRLNSDSCRTAQYWQKHDIIQIARENSEVILNKVQNEEESFKNAFKYQKFLDDTCMLQYLIKILYSITSNARDDTAVLQFAGRIISQVFTNYDGFTMKLQSFLMQQQISQDAPSCLRHVFELARFSVQHVASSTLMHFPHIHFQSTINTLYSCIIPKEEYDDYFEEYKIKFDELQRSQQQQMQHQPSLAARVPFFRNPGMDLHDSPPPDEYNKCSILPASHEINDPAHEPFLRPNLITQDYHYTSHYLDVQFRLLREDFIGPLRDGIGSLTDDKPEVTVYKGVRILEPICLYHGVGFQIQFDLHESRLDRVKWEHSSQLIYGSLLCFSSDNFKTILFASVVNRDPKQLKETGRFTVKFEGEKSHMAAFCSKPDCKYLMIESSAYFEAYRHVLEGLQQLVPDQMPFQPYLVRDCPRIIPPPIYLRNNSCFNLSNVLRHDARQQRMARFQFHRGFHSVDVTSPIQSWPNQTSLNESQLKALQMALSQELSIIQGPPGTGKTFIGLKIVQALLENRHVCDPSGNSPILVICYTNHALDQFLEGIVSNQVNNSTPNVVRIGGRCKSEVLKPFVLADRVKEMRSKRLFSPRIAKPLTRNRAIMGQSRDKFEETLSNIDLMEGRIMSSEEIKNVISLSHYRQLVAIAGTEASIEVWLELIADYSIHMPESNDFERDRLSEDQGHDSDEDDLIDVLDEPQILEEDRQEYGEEYNFTMTSLKKKDMKQKRNKKARISMASAHPTQAVEGEWQTVKPSQKQRKRKIDKWMKETPMTNEEVLQVRNIWNLTLQDRWRLYLNWINEFIMNSKGALRELAEEYDSLAAECKQLNEEINVEAMGNVDIIGMTTTGAAKHSYMLSKLNPKIVIVEEAAEVMEAHIVTSLCSSVQQLILIGDHKQLQPKPAYYHLELNYNFNISLFERLIKKGVPHVTLTKQHRMRPEIARIVGNHVYNGELLDAENVKGYPPVKGIEKSLFFIEHKQREKSNGFDDNRSRSNIFEADYVTSLTNHLLKQGYKTDQITILTMYRGQLVEIKQRMKKSIFGGVKVAAVDDFQGEENDIIILSLVRSNANRSIGFLKIENRVCVALSRAKHGMFVIGDFSMLRGRGNTVWPRILEEMETKKFLADALPLCCQNHPEEKTLIRKPEDFSNVSAGGCKRVCGIRLKCGHVCKSMCHPMDLDHKGIYKCTQTCKKLLPCKHLCSQRCCKCKESCGPCKEKVPKHLPCGHCIPTQCSADPATVKCTGVCTKRIGCGHICTKKCSEKCISEDQCKRPCTVKLDCGHKCTGNCSSCNKGRLHVRCGEKCQSILECGHICKSPCTPDCPPCEEKCGNYCFHSKCRKKCYEPCEPCREPCKWECKHFKCTATCGETCNRPPCDRPCRRILKICGHRCIGLCGEECPKLCRICNKDEVEEIFFGTETEEEARFILLKDCGHIFEVSGLDQWMKSDNRGAVQFRECPKCKTPIRRSLRYGNIVKTAIREMEGVKRRQLQGNYSKKQLMLFQVQQLMMDLIDAGQHENSIVYKLLTKIENSLKRGECRSHYLNTIQSQLSIIPMIVKIADCINEIPSTANIPVTGTTLINRESLLGEFQRIVQFIDMPFLSSQQVKDAKAEARRIYSLSLICQVRATLLVYIPVDAADEREMTSLMQLLMEMGWKRPPPSEEMPGIVEAKVKRWKDKYL